MKKIAYIELDTHAEIALNFFKLIKNSIQVDVDFYFSQKIFKQLNLHHDNISISDPNLILDQLSKKNYDLVIIGTVHRYFTLFDRITEKYPTAIIVHNLNFSQTRSSQFLKVLFQKDWKYRLKLMLKEGLLNQSHIYQKAKSLLVLDETFESIKFKFLPLFFNEFQLEKTLEDDITVVIPGAVSQHRRDYNLVLEQLKKLRHFDRNLHIAFLGKAENPELKNLQEAESEMPSFINMTYFEEKVSQPIFDDWMLRADVLWCPIHKETEFMGQKEIYGETKMTGNFGDAIKYGKLAIFPKDYQSNFSFLIPERADLLKQFLDIRQLHYDFQKDYNQHHIKSLLEQKILSFIED